METRSGTICLWHSHRLDQGFWFWAVKTSSVVGSSCAGCFCLPCTAHALPWACSVSYTGFLSCQRILLNSWCHQHCLQPHSFHCEPPAMLIGYSHEHPPNWKNKGHSQKLACPLIYSLYASPGQSDVTESRNIVCENVNICQPFARFIGKYHLGNLTAV